MEREFFRISLCTESESRPKQKERDISAVYNEHQRRFLRSRRASGEKIPGQRDRGYRTSLFSRGGNRATKLRQTPSTLELVSWSEKLSGKNTTSPQESTCR